MLSAKSRNHDGAEYRGQDERRALQQPWMQTRGGGGDAGAGAGAGAGEAEGAAAAVGVESRWRRAG